MGLRAESARAVTGRRYPHIRTFWRVGRFFFYENVRFSETRSRKIDPKVQNRSTGCLAEGYKQAIDEPRGPIEKKRISEAKYKVLGPKKRSFLDGHHVLATTGQSSAKKKVPFSQINISLFSGFGVFVWGKKRIFGPKTTFQQKLKMAVSP